MYPLLPRSIDAEVVCFLFLSFIDLGLYCETRL